MQPWVTRIWRALRPSGGRSALTALETASIPVSEEPPLANARARMKMAAEGEQAARVVPDRHRPGLPGATCGSPPPNTSRYRPTMIIRPTEPENR